MASPQAVSPLPEELVREILECAARSSPSTAAVLCCVNSAVRRCVSPILYQMVVLDNTRQLKAFLRARSSRATSAVSISQSAIMGIDSDEWPNYSMMLRAHNLRVPMTLVGVDGAAWLRNMVLNRRLYLASQFPDAEAKLAPTTIFMLQCRSDFAASCEPEMLDAAFSNVSHLYAELDTVNTSHFSDLVFHAAPVVTHLGFSYRSDVGWLIRDVALCAINAAPFLKRLYVRYLRKKDETHEASLAATRTTLFASDDHWPAVRDSRVFIDVCAAQSFVEDSLWEREAREGLDIWSLGVPLVQ